GIVSFLNGMSHHYSMPHTKSKNHILHVNNRVIALSLRELECLYYLLRGGTISSIARDLSVSSSVIVTYLDRLKSKFGCTYKNELIALALQAGAFSMTPASLL
ncbi:MAG: hypothetical protein KDH94_06200, partial [Coxiellaceae bacterium]|nr:hypothetical protein [Coxiellaceae bacterium]